MPSIPSYWVADAMAAYRVNDNLNLRLNLYNLFDEEFYESYIDSSVLTVAGLPQPAQSEGNEADQRLPRFS